MAYNISKKTPTKDIIVQGLSVACPIPFSEGHTLSTVEANVLNQVFIENIRNNTAKHVRDAEKKGEPLTAEAFQEILSEYAAGYEFGVRSVSGTRVVKDPVEQKARSIAARTLNDSLRKNGMTKKAYLESFGQPKYEELIDALLAKNPAITAEAKRQVEAQQAVMESEIDLGLGAPETAG